MSKKTISLILIFCYSISLIGQSIPIDSLPEMQIVNILDNIISANKGSIDSIEVGEIYSIQTSDTLTIGTAKVVLVKEKICALEIIDLDGNTNLEKGFWLVKLSENDSSQFNILLEAQKKTFKKEDLIEKHDYYFDGSIIAKEEYGGGGAVAGGLIAGFGLGLIGWGIGYLIVNNMEVDVPEEHISSLSKENQIEFSKGYIDKVESKRNSSFHIGAAIGTLGAVIFISSINK